MSTAPWDTIIDGSGSEWKAVDVQVFVTLTHPEHGTCTVSGQTVSKLANLRAELKPQTQGREEPRPR